MTFNPQNIDHSKKENELEPIKQFIIVDQYNELEWLVPTTNDHKVEFDKHDNVNWSIMKRWCEQNCEDTVAVWTGNPISMYFYFFNKTDAIAFKLRWA